MPRLACVDVPALPLQLLLQSHPEWSCLPVAVVDDCRPAGRIIWANRKARATGVLPGIRCGGALALAPELKLAQVSGAALQEGVCFLLGRLRAFSPVIEPKIGEAGVFWLDASGLEGLFHSLDAWAQALRLDLAGCGYHAAVVVGFHRFGTYATAKALGGREALVFASSESEAKACLDVPLRLLDLPCGVSQTLAKLGVVKINALLSLNESGILKRFGPEAHALFRFATGEREVPLQALRETSEVEVRLSLGYGEDNTERLLFILKPLVEQLLATLAKRGEALVALVLRLMLEGALEHDETIRTAEATLSGVAIMELVRLRLANAPLQAPVLEIVASARTLNATAEQQGFLAAPPCRDSAAAARAFARLRAAFGREDIVVKAVLQERHAPEGRFTWQPLYQLPPSKPSFQAPPTLVRRILSRPEPLGDSQADLPFFERLDGPYRLAGGWWRGGLARDYYFAETRQGRLLWIFYDRERSRWFLHGEIC